MTSAELNTTASEPLDVGAAEHEETVAIIGRVSGKPRTMSYGVIVSGQTMTWLDATTAFDDYLQIWAADEATSGLVTPIAWPLLRFQMETGLMDDLDVEVNTEGVDIQHRLVVGRVVSRIAVADQGLGISQSELSEILSENDRS